MAQMLRKDGVNQGYLRVVYQYESHKDAAPFVANVKDITGLIDLNVFKDDLIRFEMTWVPGK